MRPSRLPHLLRGSIAASVATFTALLSHVAAGGDMPGWLGIAAPLLVSAMAGVLLAGRRLSLLRLSVSVSISQFLFHTLFVLGAITPVGGMSGHQHGAPLALSPATGDLIAVPDAGMWLGHALAAAATTLLLYRGERAARQLLYAARTVVMRFVGLIAHALMVPVDQPPLVAPRSFEGPARAGVGLRVVQQRRRRGPPLPSAL